MEETLKALKEFTSECREDMHEPDEQGISARVIGDHLDNAMGNTINYTKVGILGEGSLTHQEYIVVLDSKDKGSLLINLADLIALARKAELGN